MDELKNLAFAAFIMAAFCLAVMFIFGVVISRRREDQEDSD